MDAVGKERQDEQVNLSQNLTLHPPGWGRAPAATQPDVEMGDAKILIWAAARVAPLLESPAEVEGDLVKVFGQRS